MKEFKEEHMLTEVAQPQPVNGSGSETDLGVLAEHLSVIADALRKTTGRRASSTGPQSALTKEHQGRSALIDASSEIARAAAAYAASPSIRTSNDIHPDMKMQRLRFSALAREAYALRRRRSVIFKNDELFGEPAWDILLDLYIAHTESKPVSVSSACIGSAAPPTTGLRWLGVLAEQDLILREHDPEDQRRVLVRLTEKGLAAMDEYFASVGNTP
jgi:Winged helix DNA-binding domain